MIEIKLPLVDKNIHDVFLSSSYLKVIEGINAKLRGKDDIIVLTGESGTGKTLIVRQILQDLAHDQGFSGSGFPGQNNDIVFAAQLCIDAFDHLEI